MTTVLNLIGGGLILLGLVTAIVPAMPAIPIMFAGLWLIAGVDHYAHLGLWGLLGIGCIGFTGLAVDLVAGALGARRVGASPLAVTGTLVGTVVGLFFGLPGLLFGPFVGAVLGELLSGKSVLRSTHVAVGAWLGLLFGTLAKLVASVTMLALFGALWWWHSSR